MPDLMNLALIIRNTIGMQPHSALAAVFAYIGRPFAAELLLNIRNAALKCLSFRGQLLHVAPYVPSIQGFHDVVYHAHSHLRRRY